MNLIKNAITYKATVPTDPDVLHNHLAEKCHTEPLTLQLASYGFVPPRESCSLVAEFPGGLAFTVRSDVKIIPPASVKAEVDRRVKALGRKVTKAERNEIKDTVIVEFAQRALIKTSLTNCFYETATGNLIVATGNKRVADLCTSLLIAAVGSVKTETLHVSNVKHGITTRLKKWLAQDDDEAFGEFQPTESVALASEKRKISVRMDNLALATKGLNEALAGGFSVTSMGLEREAISFRITSDFHLKAIEHLQPTDGGDDVWAANAAMEVANVSGVVGHLLELLAYEEPEAAEPEAAS